MPIRQIKNPDQFRTNVKEKLAAIFDNEKQCETRSKYLISLKKFTLTPLNLCAFLLKW